MAKSKGKAGPKAPVDLAALGASAVSDLVSALLGVPMSSVGHLLHEHLNNRAREAQDVLLDQLRRGEGPPVQAASADDGIRVIYRYQLAVQEGAARRNLKLLARVIVGLGRHDRLFADEFNKYAEALSRLTRDEILVIGGLHKRRKAEELKQGKGTSTHQWWDKAVSDLVPSSFETEEHVVAVCCSAMRTGLVITPRDFDSTGEYATSPIMDEVEELADFEQVLREEDECA